MKGAKAPFSFGFVMHFMKIVFAVILSVLSIGAQAHSSCLVGSYSTLEHSEFLTVESHHHSLQMKHSISDQIVVLKTLNTKDRDHFWRDQNWTIASAEDAECAADVERKYVLCELSYQHKKLEPFFADADSILVDKNGVTLLSHD